MTAWVNFVYARFAWLRAGLRRKERTLFGVFAARLKPCPDTCMADGCGVVVQAAYARFALLRASLRRKEGRYFAAFRHG
jgi:hypothetical protein